MEDRLLFLISDLHLGPDTPRTCAAFVFFVNECVIPAARQGAMVTLALLGDIFEVWIGDDAALRAGNDRHWAWARTVADTLRAARDAGVDVGLMHGNRDFLLGDAYAARCGARRLTDPTLIEIGGQRIVLCHGDTLCTDDLAYQRFRRVVRSGWVQSLYLALPRGLRQAIANGLRRRSAGAQATGGAMPWHDVTPAAVDALLAQSHASVLIHGHTHRPGHHVTAHGERWVLPDWDFDHGARGGYLLADAQGIQAHDLPAMAARLI